MLAAVRRSLLIFTAVLALVVAGLAVVVALLNSQASGKIADGVKIGSVDVGGLTPKQAQAEVRARLLAPLDAPIVVRRGGESWRLSAGAAKIRANVGAMVDEAMHRSDAGNVLDRAWRQATGGTVDATVAAKVSYSHQAVDRFVARIERDVNVEPRNADLHYAVASLGQTESKEGVALRAARLQRRITRAIATPGAPRIMRAATKTVQPKVTTSDLAEQHPVVLTIDRSNFQLNLFKGLKLAKTYDVRVGQQGLETPAGLYHIQNKAVNPAWNVPYSAWTGSLAGTVVPGGSPENPLKARWMGIFDGAGIHGIAPDQYGTIGTAASHGCVGMRIEDVEDLYDQVPVNTPIYIE
jgi:lipoprotein-anchoring transpeptidase ErfK/SrfK